MEIRYTLPQVKQILSKGLSRITFYKLDGTLREMTCTRDTTIIPADQVRTESNRSESSTAVPVYDVENDGWRSFVLENLVSIDQE
jgi:hypothetical protein